MVGSLKHEGDFPKEGHFGLSTVGLCLGSVKEDTPANEVPRVPNVFGDQFANFNGLKHEGGFRNEGHFDLSIVSLHPGSVEEDALANEVHMVPNMFVDQFAKIGQYIEEDGRFFGWIRSTDSKWCAGLLEFALTTFEHRLIELGLYSVSGFSVRG
ncbi:uncharacterized protein A4U43_C01F20980 [Asparagus officinalis]|uniref:Uncharacterized protein n=1 Tax=Asparagus officinalis TaxID=4686 RepID=A0A5P1FUM5_ASPOF|nr:uncharacterized protein A4U43_C01F20980 [Asparagus officinalis]